ncbi:MAG: DUF309 domain-containing protein [Planctomycetota bacterium]
MQPPRYAAESTIPEVPYRPGISTRDPNFHIETSPGSQDWRTDIGYLHGIDLFNHSCYWEAHEAWEHRWLPLTEPDLLRTHLQGLIQASASLLKLVSGQPEPARTIWSRGRARMLAIAEDSPDETYHGIEIPPLIRVLDALIEKGDADFDAPTIHLIGWT